MLELATDRRVITDLLIGIALTLSLFATIIAIPVLGLAIGILTPLPISFYFRKLGRVYGSLMLGVVLAVVIAMAGIEAGALFLAEFAVMGIALSETVRMRLPIGKGVLVSAMAPLVGSILLLAAISFSVDKGLPEIINSHIRQNVKETTEAYKKIGLSEEQVSDLTGVVEKLETIILKTFPSLVFIGIVSVALLNLLALKGILKKKGIEEYPVDPTVWRTPEYLVWVLIAGGGLLLLEDKLAGTIGLNLLIISGGIYLFQGMAIVAFYFNKLKTPLFLRTVGYSLILFQQTFTILVVGFGLFDLWFDFRRLKQKEA